MNPTDNLTRLTITGGESFRQMKNAFKTVNLDGSPGREYFDYYELYLITTYICKYQAFGKPNFAAEVDTAIPRLKPDIVNIRQEGYTLLPLELPVFYMKSGRGTINHNSVSDSQQNILRPLWANLKQPHQCTLKDFLCQTQTKAQSLFLMCIDQIDAGNNLTSDEIRRAECLLLDAHGRPSAFSSLTEVIRYLDELWARDECSANGKVLMKQESRLTIVSRYFSVDAVQARRRFFANILLNYLILLLEHSCTESEARSSHALETQAILKAAFDRELSIIGRLHLTSRLLSEDRWNFLVEKYGKYKKQCVNFARQWLVYLIDVQGDYSKQQTSFQAYQENRFAQFIRSSTRLANGTSEHLQYEQVPAEYKKILGHGREYVQVGLDHIPALFEDWSWGITCFFADEQEPAMLTDRQAGLLSLTSIRQLYEQFAEDLKTDKAANIQARLQEWLCFLILDRDFEHYHDSDLSQYLQVRAQEFIGRCRELITDSEAGSGKSDSYYFASFQWEYIPRKYRLNEKRQHVVPHRQYSLHDAKRIREALCITNTQSPPDRFLDTVRANPCAGTVEGGCFSYAHLLMLWDNQFAGEDETLFILYVLYYALFGKKHDDSSCLDKFWASAVVNVLQQRFTKSVDFYTFVENINQHVYEDRKAATGKISRLHYKPYRLKFGSGASSKLGSGAYGSVYHCEDEALQRDVVIKLVVPALNNPDEHDRLKEEARILATMRHQYIVNVYSLIILGPEDYELEEAGGHLEKPPEIYGIVMEYIPHGRTLEQFVNDNFKALNIDAKIELFQKICYGVQAVHDQKDSQGNSFCHGDIKPDNILIDANGEPRLIDFGISSSQGSAPKGLGSAIFASPRRMQNMATSTDDDMFSLGMLFLYLLLARSLEEQIVNEALKESLYHAFLAVYLGLVDETKCWQVHGLPFIQYEQINDQKFNRYLNGCLLKSKQGTRADYLSFMSRNRSFVAMMVSVMLESFPAREEVERRFENIIRLHVKPDFSLDNIDDKLITGARSAHGLAIISEKVRNADAKDFVPIKLITLFGKPLSSVLLEDLFDNVSMQTVLEWMRMRKPFEIKAIACINDGVFILITTHGNTMYHKLQVKCSNKLRYIFQNQDYFQSTELELKNLALFSIVELALEKSPWWNMPCVWFEKFNSNEQEFNYDPMNALLCVLLDVDTADQGETLLPEMTEGKGARLKALFRSAVDDWMTYRENVQFYMDALHGHLCEAYSRYIGCGYGENGDATELEIQLYESFVKDNCYDQSASHWDEDLNYPHPGKLIPSLTLQDYLILNHADNLQHAFKILSGDDSPGRDFNELKINHTGFCVESQECSLLFELRNRLKSVELVHVFGDKFNVSLH